jgi:hypothetical protein
VIVDTLDSLEMSFPRTDQARRRELREIRRMLKAEIAKG